MAPPSDWPAGAPGPAEPAAPAPGAATRRRRWPWVVGAGALVAAAAAGAAGALVLTGADGDDEWCDALDRRARPDVSVIVFLRPEASANGAARIQRDLEAGTEATDITYVGEEEAWQEAQDLFAGEPQMQDLLRPEDVPTSLRFTVPADGFDALEDELSDELLVLDVETPPHTSDSVRRMLQVVVEGDVEGPIGRFGYWIAPEVADELRATAPDTVAEDLDLVLDEVTSDDGMVEGRHLAAMEDLLDDAEGRCP